MLINANSTKEELDDLVVKSGLPEQTEAYKLHVKAEALRLANLNQAAISKYLNSIMLDRENSDSYYGLGICYKKTDKIDKAIEAFSKALDICDNAADIYYELGLCYLIKGEVCPAMQNLVNSLKINPDNLNAQLQLGISHEIVEETDLSLMIYQKIIETSPSFIKAYDHKSSLLMDLGRYQEAGAVLNEILKINPAYYRAYLGIGICFDKLNKFPEAARYYKKFLDVKPYSQHSEFIRTRLNEIKLSKLSENKSAPNSFLRLVK